MNRKGFTKIIDVNDLAVGYKGKPVLDGLNIQFRKGEFISLLGPNGVGKTTLLRTLAKLLSPLKGTIFINGTELEGFRQEDLAKILSVVLTEQVSLTLFTVFEFVALGRYPHTGFLGKLHEKDKRSITDSLAQVHAEDLIYRQINTLSDGERQKVVIARALAQEPRVILLDEPTIHLDLKHRMEVMSILQKLCREKGITVVASLHDVDIASKVSDCVVLVKDGTITTWGPPEEVLREETVSSLYDFKGASFNQWLGSIEIKGNGRNGSVFVVAGMGTGAILYRLLTKRGFSIVTGILHANDIDCYVAKSLGAQTIVQGTMEEISQEQFEIAKKYFEDADCVIDTGFAVSNLNKKNIQLLQYALRHGKKIFSLREKEETERLLGMSSEFLVKCSRETEVLERMEKDIRRS